jgi:homoserine O-succinyltransferase
MSLVLTFLTSAVTGAPIEHLPFEQVAYWSELQQFFEFIRAQDAGMLSLCWGAMASLYHFHDVPKHITKQKEFGVFPHQVLSPSHILAQALPHTVVIPVSRHTTWKVGCMLPLLMAFCTYYCMRP